MSKVLVTGVTGKLGRLVALQLLEHGHDVVGIDRRPWSQKPEALRLYESDIRKRQAEEVFRKERPEAVIHMATVTHLTRRSQDRFRINLQGTRAIVQASHEYGVKSLVFCGRHTYYGAQPDSPLYHTEDEPPMGIHSFPELADLVAADLFAGSALWRYPKLDTAVLRICYTLGPERHGTLATFLRGPRVPMVLGFDPLFQFMHEHDVAAAIGSAFEHRLRGVFNVAGPQPVPLSVIVRETGRQAVPVPERLLSMSLGRFGLPRLPTGALDHVKYPIVIDASSFQSETGFIPEYSELDAMRDYAAAAPIAPHGRAHTLFPPRL